MAVEIFSNVFDLIDKSVIDVISNGSTNLMSVLSPIFLSGFIIYVMLVTWNYLQQPDPSTTIWDLLKRFLAWGVVLSFSINIGNYNSYILPIVSGLGDGLSHYFINGTSGNIDSSLDSLADGIINSILDTWEQSSGVEGALLAICSIIITLIFCIPFFMIAGAYILLTKIFTAILAVLGPAFICCALFPATRQFFNSWLNQVVNYGLLLLMLNITASIFVTFIQNQFATGIFDLVRSFNMSIVSAMFFVILLKLPELASSLAGGISSNGFSGSVGAIASAGRLMKMFQRNKRSDSGGNITNVKK